MAFILRDAKNLYVAIRCSEPKLSSMIVNPKKTVNYRQLMACGEDLVEIILDPGADAKGPADLHHILIKPNGVLLAERGISSVPPLGKRSPWPVKVKVAVKEHSDLWVLEMAIPLSSLPGGLTEKLWGVNFTRFATQGGEASSWSEAPRHFYDPRNLGVMFMPDMTNK